MPKLQSPVLYPRYIADLQISNSNQSNQNLERLYIRGVVCSGVCTPCLGQEQTRLRPCNVLDWTELDLTGTMVDLPDTMVDLPNTMVDLPNTMVDLPNTMADLPNTIVDLPNTMVDLPNNMVDIHPC